MYLKNNLISLRKFRNPLVVGKFSSLKFSATENQFLFDSIKQPMKLIKIVLTHLVRTCYILLGTFLLQQHVKSGNQRVKYQIWA